MTSSTRRYRGAASALVTIILAVASPAWAATIDPVAVTLTSPDDVAARRTALIEETWGTSTLPRTLPTVTSVSNPFGGSLPDVSSVYDYHAVMSNRQVNDSDLYVNSDPNGHVVILNMGHTGTTNWPSIAKGYDTVPMMTALLNQGFSIYAMNMPAAGTCCTAHPALFTKYGNAAMQYFLQPAVEAMNYWQLDIFELRFHRAVRWGLDGDGPERARHAGANVGPCCREPAGDAVLLSVTADRKFAEPGRPKQGWL